MKRSKFAGVLILFVLGLPSATFALGDFPLENAGLNDLIPSETINLSHPRPLPVKEWTVMIYMNGKSNVEQFALRDMNRMEAAGSTGRLNVVVELGRMKGQEGDTNADGDWTGSRRYLVTKDSDPEHITSPVLMKKPVTDMGDYRQAADFVRWAKTNYPAKHYMFIIWDHGWGWIDPSPSSGFGGKKSISHDFATGHYFKTVELGKLLKKAGKVDVYASMACFMQMAEITYEIRDYADIIVGSEEIIQLPSFDFTGILKAMAARPGIDAEQAARILTGTFYSLYTSPEIAPELDKTKYGVQLSAIRSARLSEFVKLLNEWTRLVIAADDKTALRAAKLGVLRFEIGDDTTDPDKLISFYGDISDFAAIYAANLSPAGFMTPAVRKKSAQLINFVTRKLVISNVYYGKDRTGKKYSRTKGISIHIPGAPGSLIQYENTYRNLAFARHSNWPAFMRYLAEN